VIGRHVNPPFTPTRSHSISCPTSKPARCVANPPSLRDRRLGGFKFRRQHPLGAFVADFACLERRLIVEADGEQHVGSEYDVYRSEALHKQGWRVVRFWNNAIRENPNGVAEAILLILREGEEGKV
jgi:primosomal protein N' (replication factor Y)